MRELTAKNVKDIMQSSENFLLTFPDLEEFYAPIMGITVDSRFTDPPNIYCRLCCDAGSGFRVYTGKGMTKAQVQKALDGICETMHIPPFDVEKGAYPVYNPDVTFKGGRVISRYLIIDDQALIQIRAILDGENQYQLFQMALGNNASAFNQMCSRIMSHISGY